MKNYESSEPCSASDDITLSGVFEEDLPKMCWWKKLLGGGEKHERDRTGLHGGDRE